MSKECWVDPAEPVKPISRAFGLVAHPLELTTRPPDDIGIDPLQGRTQLRLVEVAVVGDPAANARIVHLGQLSQCFVAALMQRPAANLAADARQRLWTSRGLETVCEDAPTRLHPHDLPGSKLEAEKVKVDGGKVASPVHVLAVDDLRLLPMQYQLAGREAVRSRTPECPRLLGALAVTNNIVRDMVYEPRFRMGPPPRSFAADAHDCIMVTVLTDRPNTSLWRNVAPDGELPSVTS